MKGRRLIVLLERLEEEAAQIWETGSVVVDGDVNVNEERVGRDVREESGLVDDYGVERKLGLLLLYLWSRKWWYLLLLLKTWYLLSNKS